jgi:hypothetical protein
LGVLVTYPLLYHGYFMYCGLISRVCKEIKALFYVFRDFARKMVMRRVLDLSYK